MKLKVEDMRKTLDSAWKKRGKRSSKTRTADTVLRALVWMTM